jgi:bacterioferritin
MSKNLNTEKVIALLNKILEAELAGVVRYTHYSLMVYGYNRLPILSWLRSQASESLLHAQEAGEFVTQLGGHPSLGIGALLETEKHDIGDILKESLEHEKKVLNIYHELHEEVAGCSILLEEYSRSMILQEEKHLGEVDKMLRKPGDVKAFEE